jgi:hypothetical protein
MLALAYQVKYHTVHVANRVLPIAIGTESTKGMMNKEQGVLSKEVKNESDL